MQLNSRRSLALSLLASTQSSEVLCCLGRDVLYVASYSVYSFQNGRLSFDPSVHEMPPFSAQTHREQLHADLANAAAIALNLEEHSWPLDARCSFKGIRWLFFLLRWNGDWRRCSFSLCHVGGVLVSEQALVGFAIRY